MTTADIETEVRRLLCETALTDEPLRASRAAALDEVGIDSVGMINLLYRIEESFAIRIADVDVTPENFGSIECLVDMVRRKCST